MSNSFSFKRLWCVLKYEFALSWRELFYYTLLVFVFYLFFLLVVNSNNIQELSNNAFVILSAIVLSITYFVITPYIVSRIFANMHNKPRCMQFLMLPATIGEKMAARFILYFVYVCVINIVWDILGNNIGNEIKYQYINNDIVSSLFLLPFMLCGCIFKRFAIVKTFIILIAIVVTLTIVHDKINFYPLKDFIHYSINHYYIVESVFLAIGIVICYFIGYQILKRKTIK